MPGKICIAYFLPDLQLVRPISNPVKMSGHCSITNSIKVSGATRERLFNTAFNAKKKSILSGEVLINIILCKFRYDVMFAHKHQHT